MSIFFNNGCQSLQSVCNKQYTVPCTFLLIQENHQPYNGSVTDKKNGNGYSIGELATSSLIGKKHVMHKDRICWCYCFPVILHLFHSYKLENQSVLTTGCQYHSPTKCKSYPWTQPWFYVYCFARFFILNVNLFLTSVYSLLINLNIITQYTSIACLYISMQLIFIIRWDNIWQVI